MSEKVLPYDRAIVGQETGWWCGPASTQVVLNSRGIVVAEADLAREIGTTTGGTDYVGLIERVLDRVTPDAHYTSVYIEQDPPSRAQRDRLWRDILTSIDAGYGVVVNWVAPPGNYPRGVKGSVSPRYGGGVVFHYVALMGYDDAAAAAVWIADPGFWPGGYWISFDQLCSLIPPKGYCYADTTVAEPPPPPTQTPPVAVLSRAMGDSLPLDRYAALLPAVSAALRDCDCTTVDRVAMWCAQVGHESGGLRWMEELASGAEYEGRADLGNTQPGDGRRFKGRGPIQVTGRANYTQLSQWAHRRGLVPTPTFFVDQPDQLASDRYGFVGVVWYWTVARPMNSYADRGDIVGATRAVNGGTNGLDDSADGTPGRRTRWQRCRAMGAELLKLTNTDGGISMADAQELQAQTRGVFPPSDKRSGWPQPWRFVRSRFPRPFNSIVKDPDRGPWRRTQPDGTQQDGHTDADEQMVTVGEQIAWRNTFSDGITRDHGDVVIELMEDLIDRRRRAGLSTSPATDALKK